jgi:drug/metabolite transporter (DMT)-like permease
MTRDSQVQQPAGWMVFAAMAGFAAVAVAQVSNMILARANAGEVPPFSLATARWAIVAIGLAPFVMKELTAQTGAFWSRHWWLVFLAGFLGMFLCGGPVYIAGETTTAINMALIMSLSPLVVITGSWFTGIETIGTGRMIGIGLALIGAVTIILHGDVTALHGLALARGDLLVLIAMLAWSGYTFLQSRAAPTLSFLARIALFAGAGALCSLPFAIHECVIAAASIFNWHALRLYLLAGLVPGLFAYTGFAYLDMKFGSVRTSLVLYMAPVASVVLSLIVLGEAPDVPQLIGGALILGGLWASLRS